MRLRLSVNRKIGKKFLMLIHSWPGHFRAVRTLVQPRVLLASGAASLLSALACYPRLALWLDRPDHLGFLWLVLAWVSFVLWSFVFAWHTPFAEAKVFHFKIPLREWVGATVSALAVAVALHLWMDPVLRRFTPEDYPDSFRLWGAMTAFALAFDSQNAVIADGQLHVVFCHTRKFDV